MREELNGVFVPVTTPYCEDGSVNFAALKKNIEFYASTGLAGCHVLGTNGENKSLSMDEKLHIVKKVLKYRGNLKIIAGCAFESTWETIEAASEFASLGVDYITLMAPSYYKQRMTDRALFGYFTDVASSAGVPCIVYNAPMYCGGIVLSPELVKELCGHENIVAMKDSSVGNIENYLAAIDGRIDLLAGSANFFLNALISGCSGGVISLSTVFPELVVKLYELFAAKEYDEAFCLNKRILRLNKAISGKHGVAGVKYAMDLVGLSGGEPRAPLMPLDENDKRNMADFLVKEGMLHA